MIDLQECRNEIDKIDSDIIRLFGQTMKAMKGKADPGTVNKILKQVLDE